MSDCNQTIDAKQIGHAIASIVRATHGNADLVADTTEETIEACIATIQALEDKRGATVTDIFLGDLVITEVETEDEITSVARKRKRKPIRSGGEIRWCFTILGVTICIVIIYVTK